MSYFHIYTRSQRAIKHTHTHIEIHEQEHFSQVIVYLRCMTILESVFWLHLVDCFEHQVVSITASLFLCSMFLASQEATVQYIELAKKHGLTPVELALGFVRDRPFVTSSIIGSTSLEQLKEDIDAIMTAPRPLPAEVTADIETIFKRYKDPSII